MVTLDAGWYRDSYEAAERGRQEGTSDWQTLPRSALQAWATGCRGRCGPGGGEVGWSWAIKLLHFLCYTLFCLSLCLSHFCSLLFLLTYPPFSSAPPLPLFLLILPPSLLPPSSLSLTLVGQTVHSTDPRSHPQYIHPDGQRGVWDGERRRRWKFQRHGKQASTSTNPLFSCPTFLLPLTRAHTHNIM